MAKKKTTKKTPGPALLHIAGDLRPLAVELGRLKLDPENARTHDDANIAAIAASLKEFGQVKPVVANKINGQIVAGNGTYLAAQSLGWSHLAVVWVEQDAKAQRGFSVADNRTAELAGWNETLLLQQIDLIQEETPDLAAALLLSDLTGVVEAASPVELRPVPVKAPPAMTWVLIGLPTVRFGEIAETIDGLGQTEGLVMEMTANDGPQD